MLAKEFINISISTYKNEIKDEEPNIGNIALVRGCIGKALDFVKDPEFEKLIYNYSEKFNFSNEKIENIKYWCTLATWTPSESSCLALGIDPDNVESIDLMGSDIIRQYSDFRRAADRFKMINPYAEPAEIVRHLERHGAEFNSEIIKIVRENEKYYLNFEKKYKNNRNNRIKNLKNRDSIMKLIYVLSRSGEYKYELNKNSSAVSRIEMEAQRVGVKLSAKTIRRLLKGSIEGVNEMKNRESIV